MESEGVSDAYWVIRDSEGNVVSPDGFVLPDLKKVDDELRDFEIRIAMAPEDMERMSKLEL